MKPRERREEQRVAVSRRATLLDGQKTSACLLQDISGKGFFLITNQQFTVGQSLGMRWELYPDQVLECRLQVIHTSDTCIGAKITEISPAARALLQQFLQEYYSLKLNQST